MELALAEADGGRIGVSGILLIIDSVGSHYWSWLMGDIWIDYGLPDPGGESGNEKFFFDL